MVERDLIEDLALIAHPEPRYGEVDPPEAFDDARDDIAARRDAYAENLRGVVEATDEDPLLVEVRAAASRRDQAVEHLRCLLAYARYRTGVRSDYSWERLGEAAGMPYSTVRRTVSAEDVARVAEILDNPARRWPAAVVNLEVHRAYAELRALLSADGPGVAGPPAGLDADAEYRWWLDTAQAAVERGDDTLSRRLASAAGRWHTRWLRAVYPHAQVYRRLGAQLRDLADTVHHHDPTQRHVPDEAGQLTAILDELTDLAAGLSGGPTGAELTTAELIDTLRGTGFRCGTAPTS